MLSAKDPILIVDDHQPIRRTIADIMRSFGFRNFIYAEDGIMALKRLKEEPKTKLVLLDWNMPRMSGLELLIKMRESEEFKKTPVLMITAEAEKEQVLEAVNHGVNNYIVKPFTPITLQRKLKEIFPD